MLNTSCVMVKLTTKDFDTSDGNALSVDDRLKNAFAVDGKVDYKGKQYDSEVELRNLLIEEGVIVEDGTSTDVIKKAASKLLGLFIALGISTLLFACSSNPKSNVPTEYCEELVKLAEEGNVEAQMNLGKCYAKGEGVERNDEEANKWILKAAEQGNTDAMSEMGNAYLNGWGVPVDYKRAVQWFRKAAEQGNAVAQSNLGVCYEKGAGVPQNRMEAFKLYQKAAEQGNAPAQNFLADYYFKDYASIGIAQDFDKAFDLYLKAAEQGIVPAQCQLGYCYLKGLGTNQNTSKALEWWEKAGEQNNDAIALFNLGVTYINGDGISPNISRGLEYMRKAASLGHEGAIRALQMYQ